MSKSVYNRHNARNLKTGTLKMNNKIINNTRVLHKKLLGFTLIELMIVVAIIAILSAISWPAYLNYVKRGNRGEGRAHLLDTAAILERYYSDNNVYATADNAFAPAVNTTTETGKYNITITTAGTYQTYTLIATPTFVDLECANLSFTTDGTKGKTGTDTVKNCWGK
jgi:type IV pilus assembly protein PilE